MEEEMVGWHHRLNGHEFEQTPGVSEGLGNLARYLKVFVSIVFLLKHLNGQNLIWERLRAGEGDDRG